LKSVSTSRIGVPGFVMVADGRDTLDDAFFFFDGGGASMLPDSDA
jgi:hypothetical protein